MNERTQRAEVASFSRQLHQMGFVANHDGNVSFRVSADRILCTPTAVSKRMIQEEDILVVDRKGQKLSGNGKPFGEIGLHLAAYDARDDIRAVVHAHPPFASAWGVSAKHFQVAFLPEAVVSLGAEIPTVPLSAPGEKAVAALRSFLPSADAFLISGNGALAIGADLEQAYLRLELLEHLCKISHHAQALGGVQLLPQDMLGPLLEARKKAGLGKAASAATVPTVSAPTNAPAQATDLRRVVTEELLRALRETGAR